MKYEVFTSSKTSKMRTMGKTLLTLIAVITLAGTMHAQNNSLVMFTENGEKFYLILNGVKQNAVGETNVKVTGLNQPNYKAKVIFENKSIPDVDQNVYMMNGGENVSNTEITCSVSKTKKGYKIKFVSAAPITGQVNPEQHVVTYTTGQPSDMGSTTTTTTNGGGSVNMTTNGGGTTTTTSDGGSTSTTTTTTSTGNGTGTVGMNIGVNGGGTGFNMNVTVNDGTGTTTQQTTTTTTSTTTTTTGGGMSSTTTTTGGGTNGGGMNVNVTTTGTGMDGGVNMNTNVTGTGTTTNTNTNSNTNTNTNMGSSNGSGCGWAMTQTDFDDAKKSVSKQSFADKKLTVAKQIADANCLSTDQVKQLLQLFDFEANKLDFAKYAYKRTLDKNNYYKVNDVFDFSSSVDELDEYIKTVK
jgi:hypothetical protein